jgi:hypothetical protein
MGRFQGTNIVAFPIVVPSNDFDESWLQFEDVIPSIEPQKVGWEDPILAVGDFCTIMGKEPRRNGWKRVRNRNILRFQEKENHPRAM